MNKHAILHMPDSEYCFPIAANKLVLRLRTAKDDVSKVWVIYESKYKIADGQRKELLKDRISGEHFDYYTITLELDDTRIGYVFYIQDEKEAFFFSEDGLTKEYDFSKGFYNFFQYPYINEVDILNKVKWAEKAVFYQIFVDRFNIGNSDKDKSYINMKWGDIPTPKSFAGGDLRGIIEKLDYIKNLNINAIYLTPVFKSRSNHKYDIIDYMQVDENFGTNEDLIELVDKAHEKGIRVVLDAVFNHASKELKEFKDVLEKGRDSKYFDWFIIHGDKPDESLGNYEMFASCKYMPKLNTSNEEVQEFLCNIGTHYVKEYHIDGWRLDVSDEVSHDFWRRFRKEIKAINPECVIIGENWHNASNYLRGDQYDSIMNYAFTKACLDYFAFGEKNASETAGKLNDILMRNTDTVNAMMLNLLDSHDTHRFFSEVGKDKEKMAAALHLLFLFPGVPCMFYGTETFTEGGYDPDCRRCMDWDGIEKGKYKETIELVRKLSLLRNKYNLSDGEVSIEAISKSLVVRRFSEGVQFTLYINMTDADDYIDDLKIASGSFIFKMGDMYEEK